MKNQRSLSGVAGWVLAGWMGLASAQGQFIEVAVSHGRSAHWIMPQARMVRGPVQPAGSVQVTEVSVGVEILEQVATTTLDISLANPTAARLEAQIAVPVPEGAVLRGFTFQGAGSEPTAEVLAKDQARRTYDEIVARTRDPALLEFIGCNLIRSSVFPVEARGSQKVRLTYEHLLVRDGDRVDYLLPRTESIDYRVPWKISVRLKAKQGLGAVYSPSHRLETVRTGNQTLTARLAADAETIPGPFRLCYLLEGQGVGATLLAYPDPKVGGGYFLMLAGAPVKGPAVSVQPREIILVLDRSGSMAGEKLEQVRTAALQVLEGLEDGEAFNIILYSEVVESFAPEPVRKNPETLRAARAYLKGVRVRGGTNLHDALVEALRQRSVAGCLPIVLFLTDGLPTVGQTSERSIREVATKANPHERRIFTFGVGVDVNTPLLDRIALATRATATFVLPKEDVEAKVGQVFKRLAGPVLATPRLHVVRVDGQNAPGRVRDLTPAPLPDLFEGDQLVLLGQYVGEEPLHFRLEGNYFGRHRSFQFQFDLEKASTRNAFVPRLWASRKIAALIDALRDLGADASPATVSSSVLAAQPRAKELVEEVVRLSKEFGILTEYTAFLAREGTDLRRPAESVELALRNFEARVNTRSGYSSLNQEFNNRSQRAQTQLNNRNEFLDTNLQRVAISTVQQVNDRAFYRQGGRWVDSSLVDQPESAPRRVVSVGSEEFRQLVQRLSDEGRQGTIALEGEILLRTDGETILVK